MSEDNLKFLYNTDKADVWAEAFMKVFGDRLETINEGTMISWFANAMETAKRLNGVYSYGVVLPDLGNEDGFK